MIMTTISLSQMRKIQRKMSARCVEGATVQTQMTRRRAGLVVTVPGVNGGSTSGVQVINASPAPRQSSYAMPASPPRREENFNGSPGTPITSFLSDSGHHHTLHRFLPPNFIPTSVFTH